MMVLQRMDPEKLRLASTEVVEVLQKHFGADVRSWLYVFLRGAAVTADFSGISRADLHNLLDVVSMTDEQAAAALAALTSRMGDAS